jgi:hypothetical protein
VVGDSGGLCGARRHPASPRNLLFLILSVLLTYFATLGITESSSLGPTGLRSQVWTGKSLLFVCDLGGRGSGLQCLPGNSRIEEQRIRGPISGLREALIRTGGIITSCGVIMAGTFFSMTSVVWGGLVPDWLPYLQDLLASGGGLRGMVELGFRSRRRHTARYVPRSPAACSGLFGSGEPLGGDTKRPSNERVITT